VFSSEGLARANAGFPRILAESLSMESIMHDDRARAVVARVPRWAGLLRVAAGVMLLAAPAHGADLAQTIERIKPSVVASAHS